MSIRLLKTFLDEELLYMIVDQTNCNAYQRVHGADLNENCIQELLWMVHLLFQNDSQKFHKQI